MTPIIERRLTVSEVSEAIQLSEHAVLRLISSGELRAANYGRRGGKRPTWRIHPADLAAFEARRSSKLVKESAPQPRRAAAKFKRYV